MDPVGDAFQELLRAWLAFERHMNQSIDRIDACLLHRDAGQWKDPVRYDDYLPLVQKNADLLEAMVHLQQAVRLQDET